MCVLIFSTNLPETFTILRRTERDMIKNVYSTLCKVPVSIVGFSWKLTFLNNFRKLLKYKISWKSV
jgi:hypothetical protein